MLVVINASTLTSANANAIGDVEMQRYLPMLPTEGNLAQTGDDWIFEIAWPGIRTIAYVYGDNAQLMKDGKEDITTKFPEVANALLVNDNALVLDGIISAIPPGKNSEKKLETRLEAGPGSIAEMVQNIPVMYVVFDVLEVDGETIINRPLAERREILAYVLTETKNTRINGALHGQGEEFASVASEMGIEKIIGKNLDSVYKPGEITRDWLVIRTGE